MALRFIADPQGDVDTAIQLRGFAINRLDLLKHLASFQDIKHTSKTFYLQDGTAIFCQSIFGEDLIKVFVPRVPVAEDVEEAEIIEVTPIKRLCATDDNVIKNCDFEDVGYWGALADNDFIANRDMGEAYSGKYSMQLRAVFDPSSYFDSNSGHRTTEGAAYFFTKGPYASSIIPGGEHFTLKNNTSYILGFWAAAQDFVYGGPSYSQEEFPTINISIGNYPRQPTWNSSYEFRNLSSEWTYYTVQHDQTDGYLSTAWISFQVNPLVAEDGIANKVYFDFVTLRPGTLIPRGPGTNLVYNPEFDGEKSGWYSYGTGSTITYPGWGVLRCDANTTDKPSGVFSSRYLSDWGDPFKHNTLQWEFDVYPLDDDVTSLLVDAGDRDEMYPVYDLIPDQWNHIDQDSIVSVAIKGPSPEYNRTNSTFGIMARRTNGQLNGSFKLKNVRVERTGEVSGGKIATYLKIGSFEYTLAGEFTINCNTGSAPGDIKYGDDIKIPHEIEGENAATVSVVGASSITVENWRYDTDKNASSGVASYYRNELIDYSEV